MRKLVLILPFVAAGFLSVSATSQACSDIAVTGNGFAAVARTLDFEANTGSLFGLSHVGDKNTSNVNWPQSFPVHAKSWVTKYSFMGQTAFGTNVILDGINSQGVYAGFLYLPEFTRYPVANAKDSRPELAVTDTANYVLATADSVNQAVKELKQVQLVKSAVQKGSKFLFVPVHLVIRDKTGNSAVVEWIDGKTVIHQPAGDVLTNSPPLDWQLNNAKKYDYTSTSNTNRKWDGHYMNGSGFYGVPGDWTPPGRFARAAAVLKSMPKPNSESQALALAYQALQTVAVPLGVNPSPTLWMSLADLKNNIYYFHPVIGCCLYIM